MSDTVALCVCVCIYVCVCVDGTLQSSFIITEPGLPHVLVERAALGSVTQLSPSLPPSLSLILSMSLSLSPSSKTSTVSSLYLSPLDSLLTHSLPAPFPQSQP